MNYYKLNVNKFLNDIKTKYSFNEEYVKENFADILAYNEKIKETDFEFGNNITFFYDEEKKIAINKKWCDLVGKEDKVQTLMTNAYVLHNYLEQHTQGKETAIKAKELSKIFNWTAREVRYFRQEANSKKSSFHKMILTCNKGYYIASGTKEEIIDQYKNSAFRKIKSALASLNEGKRMLNQIQLDETTRLQLSEYMETFIKIGKE